MKVASGKKRKSGQIIEWMKKRTPRLTVKGLAGKIGKHPSLVSHTIWGSKNSREVLLALLQEGCPRTYLSLPEDMKEQEAA